MYAEHVVTVADLKRSIEEKTKIPPAWQRIGFEKRSLGDLEALSAYSVRDGSKVSLSLRLRGGVPFGYSSNEGVSEV